MVIASTNACFSCDLGSTTHFCKIPADRHPHLIRLLNRYFCKSRMVWSYPMPAKSIIRNNGKVTGLLDCLPVGVYIYYILIRFTQGLCLNKNFKMLRTDSPLPRGHCLLAAASPCTHHWWWKKPKGEGISSHKRASGRFRQKVSANFLGADVTFGHFEHLPSCFIKRRVAHCDGHSWFSW